MTFLEDMNRRARIASGGTHIGWQKIITETGTRPNIFWKIMRGEEPMPAQVWEYLMKVKI